MNIVHVEAIPLQIPFTDRPNLPAWRGRDYDSLEMLLVRLETSDGLVGWGEAFAYNCQSAVKAAIDDMIAPMIVGKSSKNVTSLTYDIQRVLHIYGRYGILNYALSGIDVALWDLVGKRAGCSVGDLLGGVSVSKIDAYASLFRYRDADHVAHAARQATDAGYKRIKVHATNLSDATAARNAIGTDIPLMLDTNCGWTVFQAKDAKKELASLDLLWLEEPIFPPEDYGALAVLRSELNVPIAVGENACTAFEFQSILRSDAANYLQPSVTKVGGITEFRKVVSLAEVGGAVLAPHSPYFGPGFLATLQLIGSLAEPSFVEFFTVGLEAKPYDSRFEPTKGKITVPIGSGLGCDPDPDFVKSYRVTG